jgi:hypothetical protein
MTPTQQHLFSLFSIGPGTIRAPRELYMLVAWPKNLPMPEDRDWSIVTTAAVKEHNRLAKLVPSPPLISVKPERAQPRVSAVSECQRLDIYFIPHPTNAGLTAMRATNALNAYLRRQNP